MRNEAIFQISQDPRVNSVRVLARQLSMNAELTPELQQAIADLNGEACKNFVRNQPKKPKKHA